MKKKIGFAVLVGAILGAFDGLTAWFEPAVRDQVGTIVMLSSLKSVIAGFLIGIFACFVQKRVAKPNRAIATRFWTKQAKMPMRNPAITLLSDESITMVPT